MRSYLSLSFAPRANLSRATAATTWLTTLWNFIFMKQHSETFGQRAPSVSSNYLWKTAQGKAKCTVRRCCYALLWLMFIFHYHTPAGEIRVSHKDMLMGERGTSVCAVTVVKGEKEQTQLPLLVQTPEIREIRNSITLLWRRWRLIQCKKPIDLI